MSESNKRCARCGQRRSSHIDRIDARPGQCAAWVPVARGFGTSTPASETDQLGEVGV